jgi:16S rRNA (guanine527-N7)-methyltransferase
MKTISSDWRKVIEKSKIKRLSEFIFSELEINEECSSLIVDYIDILLEKNQMLNLISRKLDLETVINEHIYDCVSPWMLFKDYGSITDIGTGAGLPGILLAILFGDEKIVLVEKSVKKSLFLKETAGKLGLKNIEIENKVLSETKIKTDVITCRAFKSIAEILSMTKKYFNSGGRYLLYKGRMDKIKEEISEAEKYFSFNYEIGISAKNIKKERHVVTINK